MAVANAIINQHRAKLSLEQREAIALRYKAGEYTGDLALEYSVDPSTIWYHAKSAGAYRKRGIKSRLSEAQKLSIIERYENGESSTIIAKDFDVKASSISGLVRRRGLYVRTIAKSVRRLPLKHDAFASANKDAAYWAGMLMADGCIIARNNRVQLGLKTADKEHIEAFRAFLGSGHALCYRPPNKRHRIIGTGSWRIEVSSKQLVDDLAQFGVVPNKSCRERALLLDDDADFWRGMVDGDGSLGWGAPSSNGTRHPTICLVGGAVIVSQFRDFIFRHVEGDRPLGLHRCVSLGLYKVAVSGRRAHDLVTILYDRPGPALARKKAIAEAIITQP